jgi:hypothetical protein
MMTNVERADQRVSEPSERMRALLLSMLCGLLVGGCVMGKVLDPVTGTGLSAVVQTYARCNGVACTVQGEGWQETTTTGGNGDFFYNAYGNLDARTAQLTVAAGREALEMRVSAPGYITRTLSHKPAYQPYRDATTGEPQYDPSTGSPYYYTTLPRPVYLCPEGSFDSDGDTLCDIVETKYGTDPYDPDTDKDGLDDAYEIFGDEQLDLAGYGADPLHRDIFVEVDYYAGNALSDNAVQQVVDAFAKAPLMNPDGTPGIRVHILRDDMIAASDADPDLTVLTLQYWAEFDRIKNKYAEPHRQSAFHYTVLANLHDGITGGVSRGIPGHDFIVALPGATDNDYAATLMHELGHNLGLNHGGPPADGRAWKPNYLSLMSYPYAYSGVLRDGVFQLDYSRHPVAQLSELALDEVAAMAPAPGSATTEADLARYGVKIGRNVNPLTQFGDELSLVGTAGANLDFDRNGRFGGCCVRADLNGNGIMTDTFPASQNDWDVLKYNGHALGGGPIGIQRPDQLQAQSEDDDFVEPDACPSYVPK